MLNCVATCFVAIWQLPIDVYQSSLLAICGTPCGRCQRCAEHISGEIGLTLLNIIRTPKHTVLGNFLLHVLRLYVAQCDFDLEGSGARIGVCH